VLNSISATTWRDKIQAKSYINLLYIRPELLNSIFNKSLTNIDNFLKKQQVLAVQKKDGRWFPPFSGSPATRLSICYPLYEYTKTDKKELVRTEPLKLQSPPTTEGEPSESNKAYITDWDKVVPGMMLRIKVLPYFCCHLC